MIVVRTAAAADALAIARLHAESWRSAYRGMLSDAYLDGDVVAEREAFWSRALAEPPANQHVLVAEEDGRIAGFVSIYGADDARWGTGIEAVHVSPDLKGRGIGARMMAAAGAWCAGSHPGLGVYLHVLQPNEAARRFYERIGGRVAESGVWKALDGGEVPEHRMTWPDGAALEAGARAAG